MEKIQHEGLVSVLATIVKNPMEFFRRTETLAFENVIGVFGNAWVVPVDSADDITQLPAALTTIEKVLITRIEGGIKAELVTRGPINPIIATALLGAINHNKLVFPKDGILRFGFIAPESKEALHLTRYNAETRVLETSNLNELLNAKCDHVQITMNHLDSAYTFLTEKGEVYEAIVDAKAMLKDSKPYKLAVGKANDVLTMLVNGEKLMFLGTDDGLMMGSTIIEGTKGMKINKLFASSEHPFLFVATDNELFWAKLDSKLPKLVLAVSDKDLGIYSTFRNGIGLNNRILAVGTNRSSDGRTVLTTKKYFDVVLPTLSV